MKFLIIVAVLTVAALAVYYAAISIFSKNRNVPSSEGIDAAHDADAELISLLSVKFQVGEDTIAKLLEEFDHLAGNRGKGDDNANVHNIKDDITYLSKKYDLDNETVAGIALMHREWTVRRNRLFKTPDTPDDDWDRWQRWDK